ncbi:MAG: peroxiredoxin [Arachnia sp.]
MSERLAPGSVAPNFSLADAEGRAVSLSDYAGQSIVVYFYPAAMTPGCTTQATDFSESLGSFRDAGYDVVGISPDPTDKIAKFIKSADLHLTLLSDADRSTMDAYGAYGTKKLYGKEVDGVIRSTFVIDVDDSGAGTVREARYNVRATGHVDKLRRELGV